MYEEGLLRAVGASNFFPEHLEICAQETGVMPMVDQIEMHPYLQQREILEYCGEHDIFPVAWSPLMAGGESRKDAKTAKAEDAVKQPKSPMKDPVIIQIAQSHKKTPAQVILHWHVQNGFGVIPKSSNEERIRQNMDIFDFELSEEEMKQMQTLTNRQYRVGDDPRIYRFLLLDEMIAAGKEPEKDRFGNYM